MSILYCYQIPQIVSLSLAEVLRPISWQVVTVEDLQLVQSHGGSPWALCTLEAFSVDCRALPTTNLLVLKQPNEVGSGIGVAIQLPMRAEIIQQHLQRLQMTAHIHGVGELDHYVLSMQSKQLYSDIDQDRVASLTDREASLVRFLLQHPNGVDRDKILQVVWGFAATVETQTLETHISRLRGKLAPIKLDLYIQQGIYGLRQGLLDE